MSLLPTDSDIRDTIKEVQDDLFDNWAKPCRISYPPVITTCSCTSDSVGQKPSSHYLHGGPLPVSSMTGCRLCGGTGQLRAEATTEEVNWIIERDPARFFLIIPNIKAIQGGVAQTKCKIVDLPKVLRCDFVVLETNVEVYRTYQYKLIGEPVDPYKIADGLYFIATWQRVLKSA